MWRAKIHEEVLEKYCLCRGLRVGMNARASRGKLDEFLMPR